VDTSRVWYQGGKFHFSPSFELFSVMTENRKQKGGPLLWTRRVQGGWGQLGVFKSKVYLIGGIEYGMSQDGASCF
jgi:hypothetical protein